MLEIKYHKNFQKQYNKLDKKLKDKVKEKIKIFLIDEFDYRLNNHKLNGEYDGCRSINVPGGMRIIYMKEGVQLVLLLQVGTHSQLY